MNEISSTPASPSVCRLVWAVSAIILAPVTAHAWNAFNVQYAYGSNFEFGSPQQEMLTVEWAGGWKYGDHFAFFDLVNFVHDDQTFYGEFSPRLSLSKVTGRDFSAGWIQDVFLAGTFERGEDLANILAGVGFDLAIPGFDFFKLNAYLRENPDLRGPRGRRPRAGRHTLIWAPRTGFLPASWTDWAGSEGDSGTAAWAKRNVHAEPQLLLDVGHLALGRPGRWYAGLELYYWHNRYGISGVNESASQVVMRADF